MLKSAIRRYATRSSLALPVLAGPARGHRISLADVGARDFPRYVLGGYERETVRFLHARLRKASAFADLGAGEGYYTRVALATLPAGGVVVAFEPRPGPRQGLTALAERFGTQRLSVRGEALGKKDTEAEFAFGPEFGYATAREGLPVSEGYELRAIRFRVLDDLIANGEIPAPDVVKVDVEGLEAEVLLGMWQLLTKSPPTLAVECHSLPLLRDALGVLVEAGYRNAIVARDRPDVGPWQVLTDSAWVG
jgi:FkbM family methyltransferase